MCSSAQPCGKRGVFFFLEAIQGHLYTEKSQQQKQVFLASHRRQLEILDRPRRPEGPSVCFVPFHLSCDRGVKGARKKNILETGSRQKDAKLPVPNFLQNKGRLLELIDTDAETVNSRFSQILIYYKQDRFSV